MTNREWLETLEIKDVIDAIPSFKDEIEKEEWLEQEHYEFKVAKAYPMAIKVFDKIVWAGPVIAMDKDQALKIAKKCLENATHYGFIEEKYYEENI